MELPAGLGSCLRWMHFGIGITILVHSSGWSRCSYLWRRSQGPERTVGYFTESSVGPHSVEDESEEYL